MSREFAPGLRLSELSDLSTVLDEESVAQEVFSRPGLSGWGELPKAG